MPQRRPLLADKTILKESLKFRAEDGIIAEESTAEGTRFTMAWRKQWKYRSGFTLIEIMIVIAIIGILLAIAAPHFVRAREGAQARSCQHNLKQILGAKERWAMDNNRGNDDTPAVSDLTPDYLKAPESRCPATGTYTIGSLADLPVCSIGGVQGESSAHVLP